MYTERNKRGYNSLKNGKIENQPHNQLGFSFTLLYNRKIESK